MLVPFILVLVVIGAYVSEGQWENLVVLRRASARSATACCASNWPRAPFVIGLVLGRIAEESLHKALGLWGWQFFTRPLSLVLIGLIWRRSSSRSTEAYAAAAMCRADGCTS